MTLNFDKIFKIDLSSLSERSITFMRAVVTCAILSVIFANILGLWSDQQRLEGRADTGLLLANLGALCFMIIACAVAFLFIAINPLIRMFGLSNESLDEWEAELKQKAEAFSYRIIIGILVGVMLLTIASDFIDINMPALSAYDLAQEILFLVFLAALLPFAYVAWTLKPLDD